MVRVCPREEGWDEREGGKEGEGREREKKKECGSGGEGEGSPASGVGKSDAGTDRVPIERRLQTGSRQL